MIRRILARHRLAIRFWSGWFSTSRSGRQIGPRPVLALHRLPDPNCPHCGGLGEVTCGSPGQDEPGYDDCHCAPFLPLAFIWLPKPPRWARRPVRNRDPWASNGYSDEPPF
ncbi:hypothetical protein AB0C81_12610 [Streptomyces roseoverticillatus]|uniref:hypothetical protein n=1 Tax=Streptomyces roseoverticillatus TaxID=66429 RepID=UPI0033E4136B